MEPFPDSLIPIFVRNEAGLRERVYYYDILSNLNVRGIANRLKRSNYFVGPTSWPDRFELPDILKGGKVLFYIANTVREIPIQSFFLIRQIGRRADNVFEVVVDGNAMTTIRGADLVSFQLKVRPEDRADCRTAVTEHEEETRAIYYVKNDIHQMLIIRTLGRGNFLENVDFLVQNIADQARTEATDAAVAALAPGTRLSVEARTTISVATKRAVILFRQQLIDDFDAGGARRFARIVALHMVDLFHPRELRNKTSAHTLLLFRTAYDSVVAHLGANPDDVAGSLDVAEDACTAAMPFPLQRPLSISPWILELYDPAVPAPYRDLRPPVPNLTPEEQRRDLLDRLGHFIMRAHDAAERAVPPAAAAAAAGNGVLADAVADALGVVQPTVPLFDLLPLAPPPAILPTPDPPVPGVTTGVLPGDRDGEIPGLPGRIYKQLYAALLPSGYADACAEIHNTFRSLRDKKQGFQMLADFARLNNGGAMPPLQFVSDMTAFSTGAEGWIGAHASETAVLINAIWARINSVLAGKTTRIIEGRPYVPTAEVAAIGLFFIGRQTPVFRQIFARRFIEDCVMAYGVGGMEGYTGITAATVNTGRFSCTTGMLERIITSIPAILAEFMIPPPSRRDLLMEWFQEIYGEDDYSGLSPEAKRARFRERILTLIAALPEDNDPAAWTGDIAQFITAIVDTTAGGRRSHRKTRHRKVSSRRVQHKLRNHKLSRRHLRSTRRSSAKSKRN